MLARRMPLVDWIAVGKVALIAFIIAGCAILVITYVRKSRRGGPRWMDESQYGHFASMRGSMPPMPLPEWVDWDDDGGANSDKRQSRNV